MKLSTDTIQLLKNFAAIQPNFVAKPGNVIQTISEGKNILARATIAETFDTEFGIYDLNEFLSAIALVDQPELEFFESSVMIQSGRTKVEYFFADKTILTAPSKMVNLEHVDIAIDISEEIFAQIKKASSVLGHSTVIISGRGGVIDLVVANAKSDTANRFAITVDDNNACKNDFNLVFTIGNLKIIPGNYKVSIAGNSRGRFLSHFVNTSKPVEYVIALDETSTFTK